MNMLERVRPETCLSDLVLDRVVTGELARSGIEDHLGSCAACSARLGELEREAERTRPEMARAAARLRASLPRAHRRRAAYASAGILLAAAALLLVWTRGDRPSAGLRAKGGLSLDVAVKRQDGRVEEVLPGDRLAAGDAIRFRIASAHGGLLAIIGLDAAGKISPYVAPTDIAAGRGDWLDGAIELDDAPRSERIVAILCRRPVRLAEVMAAGRRALAAAHGDPQAVGALDLRGCEEASLWFAK